MSSLHTPHTDKDFESHDDAVLALTKKQVSHGVVVILLVGFALFACGYFLGHQKATELFMQKINQESFADQVQYSMNNLFDIQSVAAHDDGDEGEDDVTTGEPVPVERTTEDVAPVEQQERPAEPTRLYQAQLFGGTARASQQLVDRLSKKGIKTFVVKREGKTAQGKRIDWYQVVTEKCASKADAELLVARIKKIETLHETPIVAVS